MSLYEIRPCPCGSGKDSHWESDARGIPLCRVCEDCREEKLSHYRKEVLTNPNYEAIEPIEPEPFTAWQRDDEDDERARFERQDDVADDQFTSWQGDSDGSVGCD